MVWWQIVLICLVAIVIGVTIGLLIDYVIRRFRRTREPTPIAEDQKRLAGSAVNDQESKEIPTMVPLLTRRSIIMLVVGLIVGLGLGLGYWIVSPNLSNVGGTVQASNIIRSDTGPYESRVQVQIMNHGATYDSLKNLQYQGEYYAARMQTFPFFDYLSQKLNEQSPQYFHSSEELTKILRIKYSYESDSPGVIEIKATCLTAQEALFLAEFTAETFQDYLTVEQQNTYSEEYSKTSKDLENVRATLSETELEMANLKLATYSDDIEQDPDYVSVQAQVAALEVELNSRASSLATLATEGVMGSDYENALATLRRTSTALASARSELARMQAEASVNYFEQNQAYLNTKTKVEKLTGQLNDLSSSLDSLSAKNSEAMAALDNSAIGKPSIPVSVPPERIRARNALVIGGVIGIGFAWLVLNRRWLIRRMSAATEQNREEA